MADDDKNEDEEEAPKKKGGKLILIIALILGVGLGVGGGFFLFSGGGDGTEEEVAEEEAEPEPDVEPVFVDVKNLPVTLTNSRGGILGYAFIDLKLELQSEEDKAYVRGRLPRIQDALIKYMATESIMSETAPGRVDYDKLSRNFLEVTNAALGRPVVVDVLVQSARR